MVCTRAGGGVGRGGGGGGTGGVEHCYIFVICVFHESRGGLQTRIFAFLHEQGYGSLVSNCTNSITPIQ